MPKTGLAADTPLSKQASQRRKSYERYSGIDTEDAAENWLRDNDPDYGARTSRSRKVGRYTDSAGYVLVRVGEDHPLAQAGGYALEHRLVASEAAPLKPGDLVHHRNGVRHDNAPENLQVVTHAEHMRIHAKSRGPC